jgi:hypothetical protein
MSSPAICSGNSCSKNPTLPMPYPKRLRLSGAWRASIPQFASLESSRISIPRTPRNFWTAWT